MPTALITGASSGIGEAFAGELAARKMNLILVARSQAKLEQLATQLPAQYKIQTEVIVQDLTVPGAATAVYEAIAQKNLSVDLLINNAGFGDCGAFSDRPLTRQLDMIQLNIAALVELTHLFLPQMQQRRSGSIVNIASTAAFLPIPYLSVYAATKAFVLSFSEALWAENRPYGVRVLAVCPGATETNFFKVAEFPSSENRTSAQQFASTEQVVREALAALEKNTSNVVTGGFFNQVIVNLHRFLPRESVVNLIEKQFAALKRS